MFPSKEDASSFRAFCLLFWPIQLIKLIHLLVNYWDKLSSGPTPLWVWDIHYQWEGGGVKWVRLSKFIHPSRLLCFNVWVCLLHFFLHCFHKGIRGLLVYLVVLSHHPLHSHLFCMELTPGPLENSLYHAIPTASCCPTIIATLLRGGAVRWGQEYPHKTPCWMGVPHPEAGCGDSSAHRTSWVFATWNVVATAFGIWDLRGALQNSISIPW